MNAVVTMENAGQLSSEADRRAALSVAVWVLIAVATALFLLFLAAYAMRTNGSDWSQIEMPWQLGLSTALLISTSVMLRTADKFAHAAQGLQSRLFLMLGAACGFAFLLAQLLAWQALMLKQVTLSGNPAASFFYLLTAMHGLHVIGGLIFYAIVLSNVRHDVDSSNVAWKISLCTRYWHFLLIIWLVLLASLVWLTPELVRYICGTR